MASNLYNILKDVEQGRQDCIKNAKLANLPASDSMTINQIASLFLMQNNEDPISDDDWVRPSDWWDTKTILQEAQPITEEGITYYPAYILLLKSIEDSTRFCQLTGTINLPSSPSLRADAWLMSDGAWYIGSDITHIWDKTKDKDCSLGYKTRYAIAYTTTPENFTSVFIEKTMPCLEAILGNIKMFPTSTGNSVGKTNVIFSASNNPFLENFETLEGFSSGTMGIFQNFYSCYNLKRVVLSGVTKVTSTGSYAYSNMCINCFSLQYFSMPDLELATNYRNNGGYHAFYNMFINCVSLKGADFPKLRVIEQLNGYSGNLWMFVRTNALKKLSFPSLETMTDISYLVYECANLQEINTPNLLTMSYIASDTPVCYSCNRLRGWIAPRLQTLGKTLYSECAQIQNPEFPYVTRLVNPIITQSSSAMGTSSNSIAYPYMLKEITLTVKDIAYENSRNLFGNASGTISKINLPNLETTHNVLFNFNKLPLLETFEIPEALSEVPAITSDYLLNINISSNSKQQLDVTNVPNLLKSSILDIINNLADVTEEETTYTLTLGATNLAKLTDEETAIATNKGWTVA